MNEWVEKHLAFLRERGDQEKTVLISRRCLTRFAQFCQANKLLLSQIQKEHVLAYQQQLVWTPGPQGKMPSPNTVDQALRVVRKFLRWELIRKQLIQDPTESWILGRSITRPACLLTRAQLEVILESPSSTSPIGLRDRAILGVISELGLFSLACSALDFQDLDLMLQRLRGLPLGPHLTEVLYRYSHRGRPALRADPEQKALFLSRSGGRMNHETVTAVLLRRASERVSPRTIHRSWMAHREAFLSQRLPGI